MRFVDFLKLFIPNPIGALLLGVAVAAMVFGDRRRVFSGRNAALAALFLPGLFLFHILTYRYDESPRIAAVLYTGVFLATAAMTAWGFALARNGGPRTAWVPNMPVGSLRALLVVLLALDVVVVLGRAPDDAGIYTNLGARRWAETGILPYADAKLKGPDAPAFGAAGTYGPLLYLSHLPFQALTGAVRNPPEATPKDSGGANAYVWPPAMATKLTSLAFFLLGMWSLFVVARRVAGEHTALGIAALWASSPYVIGLGGDRWVISGLGFVSHIAPSAMLLIALALAGRAFLSAMAFAAGAGLLFFPAFLFPAWMGWWFKQPNGRWIRFVVGYGVAAAAIAAIVIAFTPETNGKGPISLFLESTLEHQEGTSTREYGASIDSFWGTHPGAAAFWQKPLFGTTSLFKPTFLIFAAAAFASALWVRGRSIVQLAAITAALGAGIQLWKTHATGSYVEWYMPFLLLALIAGTADEKRESPTV